MTKGETIWNLLPPLSPDRILSFLVFQSSYDWTYRKLQHGALRFLPSPVEMWRERESMCEFTSPVAGINHGAQSKETINVDIGIFLRLNSIFLSFLF